jgi:glycosyltransferase involved in cell wall biosynthesis
LHGYDLYFERGEYGYLPFRNFFTKQLDRMFFISENGRRYFIDKLKINGENNLSKLEVARLGISSEGEPNLAYKSMDPMVIVSVAAILENKRIDLIARALSFLPKNKKVKWIHFGGVQHIDVNYANDFFSMVDDIKKSNPNLEIQMMGQAPKEKIFEYFRENYVHFFLNVSASEGIPVSMMEAGSFGIPLVGTLVGGVGEIIKDEFNGFHLHANPTPHYLSNQIQRWFDISPDAYLKLRNHSFQIWQNEYSSGKNYDVFCSKLMDLKTEKFKQV